MKNWFELKYSLRVLRKSPGHTAMCVGIVALSLCVGMIALTLVYNLLLKPLNFVDGERWINLAQVNTPGGTSQIGDSVSSFHYQYIKDNNTVFETIGAVRAFSISRMHFGETATRVSSAEITPHIFAATGVKAHLGRTLQASDSQGDNEVAVISYSLWQNYFSSNRDVVGQTIEFDENPITIVGVMPRDTAFGIQHDVWIASEAWVADRPNANNVRAITPVGKLKAGVSREVAQVQIKELTQQLQTRYPEYFSADMAIQVVPFKQYLMSNFTTLFYSIAVFSCLIVLLGAINISNLLISRTVERKQEFAIRSSVGSSAFDVYRQALSESFLICLLAVFIALPLTTLGMNLINTYLQGVSGSDGWSPPSNWYLTMDSTSLSVAFMVLTSIWLVCGIGPAFKLRKVKVSELLNGVKGTGSQQSFRSTKILVGTQIIAAFLILIVSGSMFATILRLVNTDYGLNIEQRYVVDLEFPSHYFITPQRRINAIKTIERDLASHPLVSQATSVSGLPHNMWSSPFTLGDRDLSNRGNYPTVQVASYSPDAFAMLGINIVSGRLFDNTESSDNFIPTVIDKDMAASYWPNESALGKRVRIQLIRRPDTWLTIVGVSDNVIAGMNFGNLSSNSTLYIPMEQHFHNMVQILVQTGSDVPTGEILSWVRGAVGNTDSQVAVYSPRTLNTHLTAPTTNLQMIANIFIGFAIVAVVLAFVGVFAVISRSVLQQTKDIGVRRAIGSSPAAILLLYIKQGCAYLLIGTVIGGGLAVTINYGLSTAFSDLPLVTPIVSLLVFIGLAALVAIATIAPTKKILGIEPGDALHHT